MATYTTLQDILEEAGLSHKILAEIPNGGVDGDNKQFTVSYKPLTDANYDDEVTADDLRVYYDGVPADVDTVDAEYGTITMTTAPAEGVVVTVDYRYAPVTLEFVSKRRDEAQALVNKRMKSIDSCAPYGEGGKDVPKIVQNIARQFAAAWMLIREYGYNQDTEGTSKDGYKRLEVAEAMLEEYAKNGGECGIDGDGSPSSSLHSIGVRSDGDLFARDAREFRRERGFNDDTGM